MGTPPAANDCAVDPCLVDAELVNTELVNAELVNNEIANNKLGPVAPFIASSTHRRPALRLRAVDQAVESKE